MVVGAVALLILNGRAEGPAENSRGAKAPGNGKAAAGAPLAEKYLLDGRLAEGATALLICQHQAARRVDDDLGVWRQLRGHIVKARLARDRGRCFLVA